MKPQQLKNIAVRMAMEYIAKEAEKIRTDVVRKMMAVTLLTLHDKYDFTPEMLVKVMQEIFDQFECVSDKLVTLNDFFNELESMGIEIGGGCDENRASRKGA